MMSFEEYLLYKEKEENVLSFASVGDSVAQSSPALKFNDNDSYPEWCYDF